MVSTLDLYQEGPQIYDFPQSVQPLTLTLIFIESAVVYTYNLQYWIFDSPDFLSGFCIYRVFQKSLYRKPRYKNHVPVKYCVTKMEFKATLARLVCWLFPSRLHSHRNMFQQVSTRITVRNKAELLFSSR